MALSRKVGLIEGARYKGGGPMLTWILHRISGLGIIIFVTTHVVASFLTQQVGSDFGIFLNHLRITLFPVIYCLLCNLSWNKWIPDNPAGYLAPINSLPEGIHLVGMVYHFASVWVDCIYHDPAFPGGLNSRGVSYAFKSDA